MATVDSLINARWVVPVEPQATVLEHHSIAVDDGRITAILPTQQAMARYSAREQVALPTHVLCPGFVNAHTHAGMSLLRGMADDLPLMRWLNEYIWPAEGHYVSPEFVTDGVTLAIAEMLRGGTTCFGDMYYFPDITAQTAAACGMRVNVGLIVIDTPTAWARDLDEYLAKGTAVHDRYREHPLISTSLAPHAPYTVSDASLTRLRVLADELDIAVHTHLHETAQEVAQAQADNGQRPLARLQQLQLVSPRLIAAHMTQLSDGEIRLCADNGVNVVHCPESNLKLASGFCPAAALDRAGINVALGTDGAASNNDLDMLGEARTAALLAKAVADDPEVLSAHTALRMATLNGATALGLGHQTGSIETGKWADLCAVDLRAPATQPVYNPVSQLIYAATREQVSDVWIAGRRLLRDSRLVSIDVAAAVARAQHWAATISASNRA